MTIHFADRLLKSCQEKGAPVCVGLDPVYERLPRAVYKSGETVAAIERFCMGVIDAVGDIVPCVKPQIACFERYGAAGIALYEKVIAEAKARGLVVIADIKRGDISTSADHYAQKWLAGDNAPDAITVNAYLGADSLEPFIKVAKENGRGLFALVRTSNPGGDAIQSLGLNDGRTIGEAVADVVACAGEAPELTGESGYSLLGAVVGATKPEDAAQLRKRMAKQIFLVPGFGAQGGSAEDVRVCFDEKGQGALITASRSVIYAYKDPADTNWQSAVADAAKNLKEQIAVALQK